MTASKQDEVPFEVPAPGKLILFGEHATVYGHPGIAAPIDIGMRIRVSHDPEGPRLIRPRFKQYFGEAEPKSGIELFTLAVKTGLSIYNLEKEPIALEVESDLPVGMGLGSSAAFSAGICKALRRCAGQEAQGESTLFDEVQQLESIFHGNPSGMDAATVLADSLLWFRKGPPREILPIRVPTPPSGLICIVEPGGSTLAQVDAVRRRLAVDERRVRGLLEEIGRIVEEASSLLVSGNLVETGQLMNRNHELLVQLGVSTPKLDQAADLLRQQDGVLGAKLTGSGGGGAVIALTSAEAQHRLPADLAGKFPLVIPFTAMHGDDSDRSGPAAAP